jgi:hypothetical protein
MYIIVAIIVIGLGTLKIVNLQQSIAAFLFFVGSLIIFIIYGIRWFSQNNSIFSETPVSWPPVINTCPDYLTYYKRTKPGKSADNCIDLIGVSRNGMLKVFPKDGVEPEDDAYYFDLTTKSSDPAAKNAELCQNAMVYGLTWEGITNGESCVLPSGGSSTPGGGSGGCPAM